MDEVDNLDMADCPVNKLVQQPVVTEQVKLDIEDGVYIGIALFASDYLSAPSSGNVHTAFSDHSTFSPRLFSSYRTLQI